MSEILSAQSNESSIFLRKKVIFSTFLIFVFTSHFIFLLVNTNSEDRDLLEVLKIFAPVFTLSVFSLLNTKFQVHLVNFFFFILLIHILVSIFLSLSGIYGEFISDDYRVLFKGLGRGAGETAWALCVFIVTIEYLRSGKSINYNKTIFKLLYMVIFLLILLTQSRAAILFLFSFYFFKSNISAKISLSGLVSFTIFIITIILLVVLIPSFNQIFIRSSDASMILTGREFIWVSMYLDIINSSIQDILIGEDIAPNIHFVEEIGYVTADPHNLFLDIFQYYGLFGVLYITIWYSYLCKYKTKLSYAIIFAFVIMSMFVSTVRYPFLPYVNIILLAIPIMSSNIISYKLKENKKYI
tara:strand:- start:12689 stop:13753 length:1065 start_codon:yes stop_codon:yes gene_type:complete